MSRGGVLRREGSTPHEPDLQPASQLSLSDALAPRRQRSRSIRSRPSMRRVPVNALRVRSQMPLARSRRRLRVHPHVPSSLRDVHHPGRRPDQIPIAPAAQPEPNFPRLRALALFGRRSAQQAVGFVITGVQKPAHIRTSGPFHHARKSCMFWVLVAPKPSPTFHGSDG